MCLHGTNDTQFEFDWKVCVTTATTTTTATATPTIVSPSQHEHPNPTIYITHGRSAELFQRQHRGVTILVFMLKFSGSLLNVHL